MDGRAEEGKGWAGLGVGWTSNEEKIQEEKVESTHTERKRVGSFVKSTYSLTYLTTYVAHDESSPGIHA
jgi:hypothetical protein